jgi:hypothetical protein
MQLGMKIPHDHSALYVMIWKPNVDWKLQRDFFNTIGGEQTDGFRVKKLFISHFHVISAQARCLVLGLDGV